MADDPNSHDAADDAAEKMKARLREALMSSMRAKDGRRVRVLRMLIAELDNAQAVPLGDEHVPYVVRSFGDRSAEVSRLNLGEADIRLLFARKLAALRTAAGELEGLGRTGQASELTAEAAILADYGFGDVSGANERCRPPAATS